MEVQVNWLAIILATLSTMIVGSIWYTPKVFGSLWMKLTGVKPGASKDAVKPILITLVVSFISAFVLAHLTFLAAQYFTDRTWLSVALSTAFWAWLGFTAARFITHDAFEGRPNKLTILNIGNELVTFLVMGLIIGLLPPSGFGG